MASTKFQERFKNRSAVISQDGSIQINPETAILKPTESQLHSTVIKSSASYILTSGVHSPVPKAMLRSSENSFYGSDSVAYTEPIGSLNSHKYRESSEKSPKRLQYQSADPLRKKAVSTIESLGSKNKSYIKSTDFKPYTLKDYKVIKPKDYYQLGGLGPSNIGTDEWVKKKELNSKRWKYGKDIYYFNAARLPLFPITHTTKLKIVEENPRQRALDFAKKIIKPPLKPQSFGDDL